MEKQQDMKPIDTQSSWKRKNGNSTNDNHTDYQSDFKEFTHSSKRHEIDLGLYLTLGGISPGPPMSSSPSPPPRHDPQVFQIETPVPTLFPPPTSLHSHYIFAATAPYILPFREPSFHAPAAASAVAIGPSLHLQEASVGGPSSQPRARRNPTQTPRNGKSETVPPPFPWATNHRATVLSLDALMANDIETVSGEVQCKRCEKRYEIGFNLREKFDEVGTYIARYKSSMHDRAPSRWMNPTLPTCKYCGQENSVKPLISEKKKSINWLFLFLGQMLGCCTLEQLKYFCKHTKNHRTGAKDRVLYLTYLGLGKQLYPDGPFDLGKK